MKIGDKNFTQAVEVISQFTSKTTASFNVPVHDNYGCVYPILLHNACPTLVEKLVNLGYSVGICEKGAYVEKY